MKGLRPLIWRILLNYLPTDSSQWDDTLRQSKEMYQMWKEELIIKPMLKDEQEKQKVSETGIKEVKSFHDPLSLKQDSKWKQHFDDKNLWEEIEKDVKRTRKELAFFILSVNPDRNSAEDMERLEMQALTRKSDLTKEQKDNYIESHSDAMARILFIYA